MIEAEKAIYTVSSGCARCWRCHAQGSTNGASPATAGRHHRSSGVPSSTPRSPTSIRPPTACTAPRASWPICVPPGLRVSRKTVAASLRRQGLAGISPRRFAPATTVVDLDAPVPKDLVRRRFDTGELDRVWTSDITYLRTGQGWLYLCAVRDGCSRRVIGWAIDEHLRTDLVESALSMAVAMRGELAQTVILHADRGCQYTSAQLARFADAAQPGPLSRAYRGVLG